jgi:hypothetical protein
MSASIIFLIACSLVLFFFYIMWEIKIYKNEKKEFARLKKRRKAIKSCIKTLDRVMEATKDGEPLF